MKMHGKEIQKQGVETIVFPRREGELVFRAKPITDYTDFHKLCPMPNAPEIMKPGGLKIQDVESPEYKKDLGKYAEKKANWMFIQSLSATEGLTWDSVNLSDCETWKNWAIELEASGLTPIELTKLLEVVTIACGLTQGKIEEATKRFLAGQAAQ